MCRERRTGVSADAHRACSSTARDHEAATGDGERSDVTSSETSSITALPFPLLLATGERRFVRRSALRRRDQPSPRVARSTSPSTCRRSRGMRRSSDPRRRAIGPLAWQLRSVQRGRAERMQLVADRTDGVHQRLSARDVERRSRRRTLREHEERDGEGGLVRFLHGAGRRGVVGPRLPLTGRAALEQRTAPSASEDLLREQRR